VTQGHSKDLLPVHDQLSWLTRGIELSCIIAAVALVVVQLGRLVEAGALGSWWTPIGVVAGLFAADFVSGLVHWTADTWGSETMPILGRRFVRPFRVHHVNPDDFLKRDFVDTNGDVAGIVSGFLIALFAIPLDSTWGQVAAVFLLAFCVGGLPTNQVHQWAHQTDPPSMVKLLQRWGVLLSHSAHRRHHRSPFVVNYCIATGWCNPFLSRVRFFPRLEKVVEAVTGLKPRADDQSFAASVWASPCVSHDSSHPQPTSSPATVSHD
jgi:ubiquitin-conjugating enzyme E2 variant